MSFSKLSTYLPSFSSSKDGRGGGVLAVAAGVAAVVLGAFTWRRTATARAHLREIESTMSVDGPFLGDPMDETERTRGVEDVERTVVLHAAPRWSASPHASPFVLKLEMLLRLAGSKYVFVHHSPMHPRTQKMPWIEHAGHAMPDSHLAYRELVRLGLARDLDAELTHEQRAVSVAVQRMLEEHLYFVAAHVRWVRQFEVAKATMLAGLPRVLLMLGVGELLSARVEKAIRAQGVGRLTPTEMDHLAIADILAVSALLGDREFLHGGARPTYIDVVMAAVLGSIVWAPFESALRDTIHRQCPNLLDHLARMRALAYPDWDLLSSTPTGPHHVFRLGNVE